MVLILVKQIALMFLLAGIGFLLYKGGKIGSEGGRTLGNILIYASLPAVIINGFRVERTAEHVTGMIWSAAGALALLLISILISHFVFRKDPIGAFAGAFSNPGFFGVPLILASVGEGAVFYVASFIAFLNIGQWTYGVSLLNGQPLTEGLKLKKLVQAPFVLAILAGLILFAAQIRLPDMVSGILTTLAGLNTPLAMFTVGIYLAQTDFLKMFRKKELYLISAVRLVIIPLVALLLLSLFPGSMREMKTVLLIAISCPVGSNVAIYAQLHGKDYSYAVETVILSTALSIVTIPLMVHLSGLL